jgi:hypothetical protein
MLAAGFPNRGCLSGWNALAHDEGERWGASGQSEWEVAALACLVTNGRPYDRMRCRVIGVRITLLHLEVDRE